MRTCEYREEARGRAAPLRRSARTSGRELRVADLLVHIRAHKLIAVVSLVRRLPSGGHLVHAAYRNRNASYLNENSPGRAVTRGTARKVDDLHRALPPINDTITYTPYTPLGETSSLSPPLPAKLDRRSNESTREESPYFVTLIFELSNFRPRTICKLLVDKRRESITAYCIIFSLFGFRIAIFAIIIIVIIIKSNLYLEEILNLKEKQTCVKYIYTRRIFLSTREKYSTKKMIPRFHARTHLLLYIHPARSIYLSMDVAKAT